MAESIINRDVLESASLELLYPQGIPQHFSAMFSQYYEYLTRLLLRLEKDGRTPGAYLAEIEGILADPLARRVISLEDWQQARALASRCRDAESRGHHAAAQRWTGGEQVDVYSQEYETWLEQSGNVFLQEGSEGEEWASLMRQWFERGAARAVGVVPLRAERRAMPQRRAREK